MLFTARYLRTLFIIILDIMPVTRYHILLYVVLAIRLRCILRRFIYLASL